MIELILVDAEACRPLRAAILKPGLPPSASIYPQDEDERSLHVSLKDGDELLGVASLLHDPRGSVQDEVWRVRGMAVLPEHQGRGIGRQLIKTMQAVAESRGGGLWAQVGSAAQSFYLAHGFQDTGQVVEGPLGEPVAVLTWRPAP